MAQTDSRSATVTSAYAIVTCLFFAWGFITSLVDPLVAAVKGIFHLSDVEAQLSASAFFIAYGVMSLPAAVLLSRRKAVGTVLIALTLMAHSVVDYPLRTAAISAVLAFCLGVMATSGRSSARTVHPSERNTRHVRIA